MASASGTPVPSIARLVAAHEDTVRDVIHLFNEIGLRALEPIGPYESPSHRFLMLLRETRAVAAGG
nr:helix-turn-helix domain-containing protein [Actinoplanes solisilvae]